MSDLKVIVTYPFHKPLKVFCRQNSVQQARIDVSLFCQKVVEQEQERQLETVCCNKRQKKVPTKKLVWGIGDI